MNHKNQKQIKIAFILLPLIILLAFLVIPTNIFAQKASGVLVSKDGYTLTEKNVQVYVNLLQFVIGEKIKSAEINMIRQEAVSQFNQNPEGFFSELNQYDTLMNQLYKTNEPIEIAQGRLAFLGTFHKATESMRANELPSIIKIANRYVKVLHFDPNTELLLTNKDVEAILSYMDFNQKINGLPALSYAEKQNFRQNLPVYYAQMPAQEQATFAVMPIYWEIIDNQWKNLSPKQKNQYIAQMKSQNQTQNIPQEQAQVPQQTLQTQQTLNEQQMLEFQMNQINHNLTMDIINSIGSEGNYWTWIENY